MPNPYVGKPSYQFWRQGVAAIDPDDVDPVVEGGFGIGKDDFIATAGSCFAQHIAKSLVREGYRFLVTEPGPIERTFGIFPARFGNIYSVRQLMQLFERAYGLFEPIDEAWSWENGRVVDPFRPRGEPEGFESLAALRRDRENHLAAVRRMFEEADVFIFTLGLTEAWRSEADGAIVPLAPGVHGQPAGHDYSFVNFGFAAMYEDLSNWIRAVRLVNPTLKVLLTVSPVPLVATYENRHILVSTTYSKSALRAVAGEICAAFSNVAYFPSYEIVTGAHNRARYFTADLREVTPEGVGAVMALFKKHYLGRADAAPVEPSPHDRQAPNSRHTQLENLAAILCEEESLDVGHAR